MLVVDPKTSVPNVFHRVYQHSFMAIYLLATLMDTIYPPPDLLFSGERQTGARTAQDKSGSPQAKIEQLAEASQQST